MRYFDAQVNGYVGVDFNDPSTRPEDIELAAQAMRDHGVAVAFPTIITASEQAMTACIHNVREAIGQFSCSAEIFKGLHLEGPFISSEAGYVGAHPKRFAIKADASLLERLCDACGDLLKLVTLSPEVDTRGELTELVVMRGSRVAAGHTNASVEDIDRCIEKGLSLFTHLGNGCPRLMDRHDNIILRAASRSDHLHFSLIADGHHVPRMLFEFLQRLLPLEQILVVSDAISAAGLGPGTYRLGEREVQVGADLAARDASGEHFVGAASTMRDAERWLTQTLELPVAELEAILQRNAEKFFGLSIDPN
ncbi:MAG: N-acetylglucosamine-6-phosphate deacetylase [Aureliella sp.]